MSELKIDQILCKKDELPRAQNTLCAYIAAHLSEASMLTAKQLAKESGVGEATIFRALKQWGFSSYAEFRGALHKYAVEYTQSTYWQMQGAIRPDGKAKRGSALHQAVYGAVTLLEKMVTPKLEENFEAAIELLLSAESVGVLGLRSSKSVALYLHSVLLPIFPRIHQLSHDEHFIFETLKNMQEGSLLFVVTSWPNTKMTVRAAEFCHRLGHKIILLTNSHSCPIASYADLLLIAPESKDQYTVLPYIAILDALAKEIGSRLAPKSIQKLREIDEILAEQEVTNFKK